MTPEQAGKLRGELEALGFLKWLAPAFA